jgi:hypothetical protein
LHISQISEKGFPVKKDQLTRRLFLHGSGSVVAGSMLRAALPGVLALAQTACTAKQEASLFTVLSDSEAMEFEAIAARIMPTTDTPGAVEAGVIHFMDSAFASIMQQDLDSARRGLESLQATLGESLFSGLDDAAKDRQLVAIENSDFFTLMRNMTLYGFFGMSHYGGNRDNVGWKLLGVDNPQHGWQPPFGYYDAEYAGGPVDGA